MRIEHVEHSRDGSVVNGFVRIDQIGVVLLDEVVNLRKLAEVVANIAVRSAGDAAGPVFLAKSNAQKTTKNDDYENYEERATRATGHVMILGLLRWRLIL
ncbi:MAG TPA: hypothetical protein VN176_18895 [Verrucomicrobiae bacterium]|nr:hypothetical protein [Verrucomicrobiae bacterium]